MSLWHRPPYLHWNSLLSPAVSLSNDLKTNTTNSVLLRGTCQGCKICYILKFSPVMTFTCQLFSAFGNSCFNLAWNDSDRTSLIGRNSGLLSSALRVPSYLTVGMPSTCVHSVIPMEKSMSRGLSFSALHCWLTWSRRRTWLGTFRDNSLVGAGTILADYCCWVCLMTASVKTGTFAVVSRLEVRLAGCTIGTCMGWNMFVLG